MRLKVIRERYMLQGINDFNSTIVRLKGAFKPETIGQEKISILQ